jgi:hypothetical protein
VDHLQRATPGIRISKQSAYPFPNSQYQIDIPFLIVELSHAYCRSGHASLRIHGGSSSPLASTATLAGESTGGAALPGVRDHVVRPSASPASPRGGPFSALSAFSRGTAATSSAPTEKPRSPRAGPFPALSASLVRFRSSRYRCSQCGQGTSSR